MVKWWEWSLIPLFDGEVEWLNWMNLFYQTHDSDSTWASFSSTVSVQEYQEIRISSKHGQSLIPKPPETYELD